MTEYCAPDPVERMQLTPMSLVLEHTSRGGVGMSQTSLVLEKVSSLGIDDPSSLKLEKTSSVGIEGPNLTEIGEDLWCRRWRLQIALVTGQKLLSWSFGWLLPLPTPSDSTTTHQSSSLHRFHTVLASLLVLFSPHSTYPSFTMHLPSREQLGSIRDHQQRLHGTGVSLPAVCILFSHQPPIFTDS